MTVTSRIMTRTVGEVVRVDFVDAAIMDALQILQIQEELYELVDLRGCRYLLLDFSRVRFLSSQTLGAMLKLRDKLTLRDGWLGLVGLKKELRKIFRLVQLDKTFDFYDNEGQALADVRERFLCRV